jgi:branched-chain amino acid transport system ATP-binding protein
MSLLEVNRIDVHYGDVPALREATLRIEERELVSIIGANGAGKTTLVKTISGLLRPIHGEIFFCDQQVHHLPAYEITKLGLIQVPEGRRLFPNMTVLENLEIGAYIPGARHNRRENLEYVFQLFPILQERMHQLAGTLSGGEQQMAAISRGLMAKPKLLVLDEPSLGLSPILVRQTFSIVKDINEKGISIFLVEQNVFHALSLANRGYVLENGRIVLEGNGKELLCSDHVKKSYLGI